MQFLTKKQIEEIQSLYYPEESFEKFSNPNHPAYKDYKDRKHEEWHDRGNNNAIDSVLRILGIEKQK